MSTNELIAKVRKLKKAKTTVKELSADKITTIKDTSKNYTENQMSMPSEILRGHEKNDFFALKVKGNSMYPKFIDGDVVFVEKCELVDSGSIAVVLYNGDEATVKKIEYKAGENWFNMIPINPEYETKHISGHDLEQCRILGKVVKLVRDV